MSSVLSQAMRDARNPEKPLREKHFPTGNKNYVQRKKDAMKARDKSRARKLIKPENARAAVDLFNPGMEAMHCITCGDFVMCDLLVELISKFGRPEELIFSTLSMSEKNAASLAKILKTHQVPFTLLLSHYFKNSNGKIFTAIENLLINQFPELMTVKIYRSHAKVFLLDYGDLKISIESSANLRSSNNIEQFTIYTDPDLFHFHKGWITQVMNHDDE